ncbi:Outer membrane porin protein 32 [Paraburkholderia piptadeniae]|uniref:Outer membrane porin protein 32 n=1 Tax=Paraburkholderia piptadeniae TaxID=1701573 RepID=A0A1N7SPM8_9BURK|nr:porin [Paraburkholderia piptadeniae]SIT49373.1 Outer membrane porin protein 32 [Paraburkholderia piptadeniae]
METNLRNLAGVILFGVTFLGAAREAAAQTSVTLYGKIVTGILYTNDVKTSSGSGARIAQGSPNGSRWGMQGVEDLGGGLSALFALESGYALNAGTSSQQGRLFGRRAFVGLASERLGTVTLGRQYDPLVDLVGPLSLTGTEVGATIAAHPYDNDNLDNLFRVSNSVKYAVKLGSGFNAEALYGFSNKAGGFANNRAYSGAISYQYNGFYAAAGYLQLNNSSGSSSDLSVAVSEAPIAASRQQTFGGGVNYSVGNAILGLVFTQSKFENASAGVSVTNPSYFKLGDYVRFNNIEVNGRYQLTPAFNIAAQYTYTDAKETGFPQGDSSPKFDTATATLTYAFSKRTDVYLQGAYTHIQGHNFLGGAYLNVAGGASSTNTQAAVALGMHHRF